MIFDPKRDLLSEPMAQSDWAAFSLFARFVFDTFVRAVVRGQYQFGNPHHVTLQVEGEEAILFVSEAGRTTMHQGADLHAWAFELVAGDVLSLEPDDIDTIYLDGIVGGDEPYLYVAGGGVMLSSGEPVRKGKLL